MKNARIILVLAGLAVYLLLFFSADLPTLKDKTGEDWGRGQFIFALCIDLPGLVIGPWFGDPAEFSVFDRVPVLLWAGAILGWAVCLGWLLMAAVRAERGLSRLEVFVFAAAVGLGVIGTFVLAVGLIGWLGCRWVFIAPALLTFGTTAWLHYRRGGSLRAPFSGRACSPIHEEKLSAKPTATDPRRDDGPKEKHHKEQQSKHSKRGGAKQPGLMDFLTAPVSELSPNWLWLGVPFVAIIILGGMLPPVDFDVREYHLQAPKEFFQQGQITFLPHNVYANMPLGAEMFALLGMVLTGDWWLGALVGKTVIAAMTPLTALALLAAGRRFFSPSAGIVAALVYISIPWIVQLSMLGLVEGPLAYYLLLAVYALMLFGNGDDEQAAHPCGSSMVLLAGYMAGCAAAIKYPAVLFVVIPLAGWVLVRVAMGTGRFFRNGSRKSRKKGTGVFFGEGKTQGKDSVGEKDSRPLFSRGVLSVGVFLLAVVVGCGLWFGKNWALTGNPTYPLLYGVFGGESWTTEKDRVWNNVHRPHDFSPKTLISDLKKVGWRSKWLSPLLVPLAILAFLNWRRQRRLMLLLLAYSGFVIAAWWLLTHRIDRFWIPITAVLALLAGAGACWCCERWWRVALSVFLAIGLGANGLLAGWGWGYNQYFVSLERLRYDSPRVAPWHKYLNTHVGDGQVLSVGDAQVFDIKVRLRYNVCFDTCLFEELAKGRKPEEVRAALADAGITHIYVDWDEIDRYRRTGYGFTDFVQPEVFAKLVTARVLERPLGDRRTQLYRVRD